jgi:signal peptidase I
MDDTALQPHPPLPADPSQSAPSDPQRQVPDPTPVSLAWDTPDVPSSAASAQDVPQPEVTADGLPNAIMAPSPAESLVGFPADRAPSFRTAWTRVGAELAAGAQTLFSAAVYATLIVTFGFQVARVDGLSMAPTLEDHDRLIVNKLVYELGDPRPGDIVMLYYPLNPDKMFVKRVIASEGDVVRIVDGHVYVNDIPLHDDYVPEEFRSHDDWGPTVIQQGYYFVMGDHRNNSSDSRHWGQVPKKYIVGKVKVRWWPLQDARIF